MNNVMGYLLIKPEILTEKGIEHFETLPDGRAIVDFSMMKVLGSMTDVEIVSTAEEVLALREKQEKSGLYDKPTIMPETGIEEENTETETMMKGDRL